MIVEYLSTISGLLLAQLLKVEYSTLTYDWRAWLHPANVGSRNPRYDHAMINEWFASSAHGFDRPPTVDDLVGRRVELITPDELVAMIPRLNAKRLQRRGFRQRNLQYLHLRPTVIRYSRASAVDLATPRRHYTTEETCRIFGLRRWNTVKTQLVKTGRLAIEHDPLDRNFVQVPHAGVVACLQDLLAPNIPPGVWIEDRLADDDWLLTGPEAAVYLSETLKTVRSLLDDGRIQYIYLPARTERLMPKDALLAHVERSPLSVQQVARCFGVSDGDIREWYRRGILACPLHDHRPSSRLYQACLVAIVKPRLSRVPAGTWMKVRLKSGQPLLSEAEAARGTGLTTTEIRSLATSHQLAGIRGFDDAWRFGVSTIERFRWELQRGQ